MLVSADKPNQTLDFRIRTITAGITLEKSELDLSMLISVLPVNLLPSSSV